MATARKRQDEKNLKTLRELGALPQNKYCFDCNQRGPTYVNVTIGSFVCTKCSGILRGITPPHRVKAISMATFTLEDVELLRSRGNEFCKRVWLGLYEGTPPTHSGDEQVVRDFMVDKYEKQRYYLEPPYGTGRMDVNKLRRHQLGDSDTEAEANNNVNGNGKIANGNGVPPPQSMYRTRPEVNHQRTAAGVAAAAAAAATTISTSSTTATTDFIADFDKADIFSSTNNNQPNNSFANFDNNPVFSNNAASNTTSGMPTPATLNNINMWNQQQNLLKGPPQQQPQVDKYAALKDLDNEMKSQATLDWSSTGSNGSLYSTPTNGSVYSSPSPQNSVFGSPSQGQFMSAFPTSHETNAAITNGTSNPFSNGINGVNGINWTNGNNGFHHHQQQQQQQQPFANPFHESIKTNGYATVPTTNFQSMAFPINGTSAWTPNPFKVGAATNSNSNNPFL